MEAPKMSSRRKTVPSTTAYSRSSSCGRGELIAKGKTKTQSAKKRTALDDHFYRTFRCSRRAAVCYGLAHVAGSASKNQVLYLLKDSGTITFRKACDERSTHLPQDLLRAVRVW